MRCSQSLLSAPCQICRISRCNYSFDDEIAKFAGERTLRSLSLAEVCMVCRGDLQHPVQACNMLPYCAGVRLFPGSLSCQVCQVFERKSHLGRLAVIHLALLATVVLYGACIDDVDRQPLEPVRSRVVRYIDMAVEASSSAIQCHPVLIGISQVYRHIGYGTCTMYTTWYVPTKGIFGHPKSFMMFYVDVRHVMVRRVQFHCAGSTGAVMVR